MRVAFVTCHLPYPPVSGGRRRELELMLRVARHVEVDLVCVSKTVEEDRRNATELEPHCRSIAVFPAAQQDPPAFSRTSAQELRHRCRGVDDYIAGLGVDVIHLEGFYLQQHVPKGNTAPVLLTEQNVEFELYTQRKDVWQARATRLAEIASWKSADRLAAVTAEDAATMQQLSGKPVVVVPDGIELPNIGERPPAVKPRTILYVGNFDYAPNLDGAEWLLSRIMPKVWARVPDAVLHLVGNAGDRHFPRSDRRVLVTGRVPDLAPYYQEAAVFVCPLRVGGGVKVKMLEAIAYGKAIVSTSVGLQGLGDEAAAAIGASDSAEAVADRLCDLLRDDPERAATADAVTRVQRYLPSWDDAAAVLLDIYRSMAPGKVRPTSAGETTSATTG